MRPVSLGWLWFAIALSGCQRQPAASEVPPASKPTSHTAPTSPPPDPPELDEEPSAGPRNSPVSLTASDGSGLQIVAFTARAVVQDPLAFTELHITFHNPQPRQIEGQFSITLPSSATLSRFAMKQDWGWQEGEVVEVQAARQAYEDFLHRRQDPALLEKQPGNQFSARVFPIAASSDKELILSYSEALTRSGEPYRVHLRGLPVIERLDVQAIVGRRRGEAVASSLGGTRFISETVEVHKQHLQPDADFVIPLPAIAQQPQTGLRSDELVLARVTPVAQSAPDPIDAQSGLLVLFDTSASRALGYDKQVARLGEILAALGPNMRLKLVAFDQEVAEIYEGPVGNFGKAEQAKLIARQALGASDLAAALSYAAQQKGYRRLLLVTDGVATAGATEAAALRTRVLSLTAAGIERLDAVVAGGLRDADRLAALTTAGLPRDGVVVDAGKRTEAIARRLGSATISHLKVSVPGATWVWPAELNGLQPGDQALVYAALPAAQTMVVNLDGPSGRAGATSHFSYPIPLTLVERPLLERAAVAAQIKRLQDERGRAQGDKAEALRRQIVDLSTKFRVLCEETALLVLETEADYARFGIDRRALADVLTVGAQGLEVTHRRGAPETTATLPRRTPTDDLDGLVEKDKSAVDYKADEGGQGRRHRGEEGRMGRPSQPSGRVAVADPASAAAPAPAAPPPAEAARRASSRRSVDADADGIPDVADSRGAGGLGGLALRGQASGGGGFATRRGDGDDSDEFMRRARIDPYTGEMKQVMALIAKRKLDAAGARAQAWRDRDPGDVLALIALGEVAEARGDRKAAARAYGSIIDLFAGRADLRRFAGERLERLGSVAASLVIDTYRKARDQRPDHPASHRLLAYAQLRSGDLAGAFDTILAGAQRRYPDGRFRGVDRILNEDVGLIGAAWAAKKPNARPQIEARVAQAGSSIPTRRSLRFVLNWETDANDVDFHILDGQGGHAYYSRPQLASGGELYADVTTGYGPECFTIVDEPRAYPYRLQAHYYSRGPMGYGMGKLEIIEHDGKGGLRFEERAFVIMQDQAFVDLGVVKGPLK